MRRLLAVTAAALALCLVVGINRAGQKKDVHDPANAVANLDVHPDLQATLFAHEDTPEKGKKIDIDNGGLTNPTNLDIDHRGRVWVCDVMNYRGNNGKRPRGDRILIYEDTDGDGKADKMKVFYQGRDIDSAMGICVLGNKVIVSASPNVFVFTFDENDKITKKEVLFTKTGVAQHDHTAHSFLFGPDGRLYWNFGNEGHAVHDKNGKPVIDLAGNTVRDNGQPYRQGMVFRCDLDGTNFEVLGHNFRNNYEVTVDSFGTLWQSDNDDDGNRGVRINYVMEYGNFGYVDEMTGAGWGTKRTNMEKEIPERHWHLNDPGVVPNLLQTGGGSPTGICIYEGKLLPNIIKGQVIHCDAGPSIVRAYPVTVDGAGYKAKIVDILDGAKKNNWFRPADVCTAPDGSIFVTDWYDPGVGGHQQRDLDRGRIFRVAPPKTKYEIPKVKFETIEDNIAALKSPNLATRYLAWTNLHKQGDKAEEALLTLYKSPIGHERARALWLLGQIDGKGKHYAELATADADPRLRVVGIRLARQLKLDVIPLVKKLVNDPSPAVRRDCAIALRHNKSPQAADLWASLAYAAPRDGRDRWYLEALGIGADGQWDAFLETWIDRGAGSPWVARSGRDIVWRSRAKRTPELLALLITGKFADADEYPRLMRAFDFQAASPEKDAALVKLAFSDQLAPAGQQFVTSEALLRIKTGDITKSPAHAVALAKLLDRSKGTPLFVALVAKFKVPDRDPELLAIAQKHPGEQLGVDAMRVLLDNNGSAYVEKALGSKNPAVAAATAEALGNAAQEQSTTLLLLAVQNTELDLEVRRQAARGLPKTKNGALQLIKLAQAKQLAKDLEPAAGAALHAVAWKDIRGQAEKLFPPPASKDNRPLPTITELAKLKGNAGKGKDVFAKAGTCANCHVVNGEGKEVGPNLSEIGKKLAREAMYESILYPSASISHNYETYVLETKDGVQLTGLLISKTPAEVVLKGNDALQRTFKTANIETLTRSPISIMPADLHKALSTQDLADLVEYMQTLREAKKAGAR